LIAQNVLYRTFDHFVFLSDIGRIALQNTQANAAEFEALIQTLIDEYNAGKFDKPPVFSIHP
jgi:hypothetical protein